MLRHVPLIRTTMPGSPTYLLDGITFQSGAGLPLTDRGFRYGMSVFETIAIRSAAPLLLEPHLALLAKTAAAANFHPPAAWLEATRALLAKPPIEEGVVRIYITAGDRDGEASRVALLFEAMPIPTTLSEARAVTVEFTPALPFGKTGNYWPHLLARPASGEEAILCTPGGHLLGGAMANLFLVIDDKLLTPRHPIRRGIVRNWISGGPGSVRAEDDTEVVPPKFHAEEADLTRADLEKARAAFLTNSRLGLCQLTAIDGRTLAGDPRIDALWQHYCTEVLRVS